MPARPQPGRQRGLWPVRVFHPHPWIWPPAARSRDGGGKPEQAKAPVAAPAAGAPASPQQGAVLPKVAPSPVTPPAAGPSAAVTQPPQQSVRPAQRDQVVTPAAPPRVER